MAEQRKNCQLGLDGAHDCHADTPECIIEILPDEIDDDEQHLD